MATTMPGENLPLKSGLPQLALIVGVIVAAAFLAVFLGLIAVTANLIFVAVAVGLILGTMLLAKPAWNIWLILTFGLLVAGVLPIWVDFIASKAIWGISILGFMLLGSALFWLIASPGVAKNTPVFVWIALAFFFYVLLTSFAQWHSTGEFFSGLKRYFQMWGLLFALCWLSFDKQQVRRWRVFILFVALMQLPFAVYELIDLVPLRETFGIPGLVPIDVVAGTFGSYLYSGGANAEMATFLIIVLAFLLAQRQEKQLSPGRLVLLTPLVMAPLFLGETKVVVILLPVMFLMLYRNQLIARPHYALFALMLGTVFTFAAGYTYLSLSKKSMDQQVANMFSYEGYGNLKLNRYTTLTFWAEQQGMHDPVSFVLGNGIGSSVSASLAPGHVAKRFPDYGIGLTAASTLLWETGIFGFSLFLALHVMAWRAAGRLRRRVTDPSVRADLTAIQAAIALFAIYLFYRSSVLDIMGFQIVFVCVLGYLAWLHRRYGEEYA